MILVDRLGQVTLRSLRRFSDLTALLAVLIGARVTVAHGSRRRIFYKLYFRQIYHTGVEGLGVASLVAALLGAWLITSLAGRLSGENLLTMFSLWVRDNLLLNLGPFMCAVILIARSGTAATAKIGFLQVFREFDVLRGMGINPVHLILVPVFFAFISSMLITVVVFDVVAMGSVYLTLLAVETGLDPGEALSLVVQRVTPHQAAVVLVKSVASGIIIGLYSIQYGAQMLGDQTHVARAMSNATSRQLVWVFVAHVAFSLLAQLS